MKIRALAIIAALALPGAALADKTNEKTTNTAAAAKLADSDVKIVAHLHHVNQMEIDLGKAAQKSTNAAVKSYGDTLVKDHQSNDKDLTAYAKSRKLATIPADKPETEADKQEHKAMMSKMATLKTLKGAEFDREFLSMMATDHDKEIAKLDVAIGATTDTDLQTLLKATKPVLQRHADSARDLQNNAQASTTTTPTTPKPSGPK
jgi:putative membrane protein